MDINTGSAFILGLLGTGHCLGMCGPLVVSLPGAYGRWQAHLFYHAGRLTMYTLTGAVLGALASVMGRIAGWGGFPAMQWTGRLQVGISIIAALFLVILGLARLGLIQEPGWMSGLNPQRLPGYALARRRLQDRGGGMWLFAMGTMLGLLPCGLSYAAFARALAAQNTLDGGLLCLAFGLGTLPGLVILASGMAPLWRRFRVQAETAAGLLMIGMAASLLADLWAACL